MICAQLQALPLNLTVREIPFLQANPASQTFAQKDHGVDAREITWKVLQSSKLRHYSQILDYQSLLGNCDILSVMNYSVYFKSNQYE
jgi:hypothetical protein